MARSANATIAYFSMEVGLESRMPTYSGGLGVLAGDTLRAAADMGVPMVGITLLHRQGYFRQQCDHSGNQSESPSSWSPDEFLEPLSPRVTVVIEGQPVQVRAWRYLVRGVGGRCVPVYFLDTCIEGNAAPHKALTDHLYGGDLQYRLCQEVVLGMGGVAMLNKLGHEDVRIYHMNEGHSALLTLGLLSSLGSGRGRSWTSAAARMAVRSRCVFTTHTPVPAGHDQFPVELVERVLGAPMTDLLRRADCCLNGTLNMTYLALRFSHYVNGVAMRHGEISRGMFPTTRSIPSRMECTPPRGPVRRFSASMTATSLNGDETISTCATPSASRFPIFSKPMSRSKRHCWQR